MAARASSVIGRIFFPVTRRYNRWFFFAVCCLFALRVDCYIETLDAAVWVHDCMDICCRRFNCMTSSLYRIHCLNSQRVEHKCCVVMMDCLRMLCISIQQMLIQYVQPDAIKAAGLWL